MLMTTEIFKISPDGHYYSGRNVKLKSEWIYTFRYDTSGTGEFIIMELPANIIRSAEIRQQFMEEFEMQME